MRLTVSAQVVAEFARSKYKQNGRGAVVVHEQSVVETIGGQEYGTGLAYLYEGSDLFEQVGRRWPGTTGDAVRTYDPEREMVIITLDRENNLDAYLLPLTVDEE